MIKGFVPAANTLMAMAESCIRSGMHETARQHLLSVSDIIRAGGDEPLWEDYPKATRAFDRIENPELPCACGSDKIDNY